MTMLTFYAPTFLDESMTHPGKRGHQRPTGKLSGMVFTRRFFRKGNGKIKAERGLVSFSWDQDTQEAKVNALAKAIKGMEELPDLDKNPPLNWIPPIVKEKLT
jgi:hypothetical protein